MKKVPKALLRGILRLLAAAVVFAMLFSACFLIAEADHECAGEDCPICYQVNLCSHTVRFAGIFAAAVFTLFSGTLAVLSLAEKPDRRVSLVTLKVKLSN